MASSDATAIHPNEREESACVAALGVAVRGARRRAALTQAQLAERAGVRRELIGQIERGMANPTLAVILRLARGLGVSASQLARAAEDSRRRAAKFI